MLRVTATAFFILVSPLHALAEKRVALVMGADDYKIIRPLVNDALAIGTALEKAFRRSTSWDRCVRVPAMRRTENGLSYKLD